MEGLRYGNQDFIIIHDDTRYGVIWFENLNKYGWDCVCLSRKTTIRRNSE